MLRYTIPLLLFAACAQEPASAPEPTAEEWSWVAIASFVNPSLSEAGALAHDTLYAVLAAEGINAVSAGSRGFTMNVSSLHAKRARTIAERVIEAEGLEAWLAPE